MRQFIQARPALGYGIGRAGHGFANELTAAIATVYMLGRGLSFESIGVVWTIHLLLSGVLNVPTGAWADQAGRRRINGLGMVFLGLAQAGFAFSRTAPHFFVSAILFGCGAAAASGSLQAWLVDAQIARGQGQAVARILANVQAVTAIAGIAAGLFVGTVFKGSLHVVYIVSAGLFIAVGTLVLAILPENYGKRMKRMQLMKESFRYYFACRPLQLTSFVMLCMYAGYTAFLFTWQPKSLEVGWPALRLGLLHALYLSFLALGSFSCGRIVRKGAVGAPALLSAALFLVTVGLWVEISASGLLSVVTGIALFALGYGVFIPTTMVWINEYAPSEIRASLISVINMVALGIVAVLQVVMGAVIDSRGLTGALYMGCGFTVCGGLLLLAVSIAPIRRLEGWLGER